MQMKVEIEEKLQNHIFLLILQHLYHVTSYIMSPS